MEEFLMHHDPHRDGCAELPFGTRLWHGTYCTWYDHNRAGHRLRAAAWGFIADRVVRFA